MRVKHSQGGKNEEDIVDDEDILMRKNTDNRGLREPPMQFETRANRAKAVKGSLSERN